MTALAMAAATTTMTIATMILGRNAMTSCSSSLIGLGPNTLNAITRVNRMTAYFTSLATMSEASYWLLASACLTPPRSTALSKPTRSRMPFVTLARIFARK